MTINPLAGGRRTQPRARPLRTSGSEDQPSRSHESKDRRDPVEEITAQPVNVAVDGHSWTTRSPAIMLDGSCTTQVSQWEERQKTQSRRNQRPSIDEAIKLQRNGRQCRTAQGNVAKQNPESVAEQHEKDRPRSSRSAGRFSWNATLQSDIQSHVVTRALMLRTITSMIKEVMWLRKQEHVDNDNQEAYCLNSVDKAQRSRASPRRMTSRVTQSPIPLSRSSAN